MIHIYNIPLQGKTSPVTDCHKNQPMLKYFHADRRIVNISIHLTGYLFALDYFFLKKVYDSFYVIMMNN